MKDQYAAVIAIVLLTGFAIQQALQMLDLPISFCISRYRAKHPRGAGMTDADFKKAVMTVVALIIAGFIVYYWDIRTLYYIDVGRFPKGSPADVTVTTFVLSAGTEGVNTLIKYFGYVKDARGQIVNPKPLVGVE